MRKIIVMTALLAGMLGWQCSRTSDMSLKSSLDESVEKINTAMAAISVTKGYELMTITDLTKSEDGYADSITLDLIAGIYDFKPKTFFCRYSFKPRWKFEKSAESEMLILNLPQKLVFHPWSLFNPNPPDELPENDFTITASDYHCYYSLFRKYDYKLTAGFTLEGEDIGMLDVMSTGETFADRSYSSKYDFTDNYSIMVTFEKGDTSVSSFALMEGDDILLAEERFLVWKDFRPSERKYVLTIGNVQIVRGTGIDSIQVFLNGMLQQSAGAVIINDDGEGSICHRRDILLTFDDGTTAKLSELLEPALETLKSLYDPMREMYFAKRIVDHLAFTVYYQRN